MRVFGFTNLNLRRSNSFAVLRPSLIVHLNTPTGKVVGERDYYARSRRFGPKSAGRKLAEFDAKLARAREVLAAIAAA